MFEKEYKYIEDVSSPARISVSNLKKNKLDEDEEISELLVSKFEDENIDLEEEEKVESNKTEKSYRTPTCLSEEEKGYTAVRKGLLIHFILQNLDFKNLTKKSEIANYIEKLVFEGTISQKDKKYISITRIYNFLNSKIGRELKNATYTYREYEFILKNEKISNSLIQGVIDLFYVTQDGKVILVDFKTDRLDDEAEFIKRYKIQLDIYKEAINSLTNYTVDKVYIYSFNLNKEIEVVEEENE